MQVHTVLRTCTSCGLQPQRAAVRFSYTRVQPNGGGGMYTLPTGPSAAPSLRRVLLAKTSRLHSTVHWVRRPPCCTVRGRGGGG